jgi:putative SOS response-associated peptidase YedK
MCGRYTLTSPLEGVRQLFDFIERPNLIPRANIAPTHQVPVVRLGGDGKRHLDPLRWGLVPSWAKEASIGARLINARGETVASKPSFRRAFVERRCLVPADGFYEWKTEEGAKQPYRITLADGGPFAFAGLWERWRDPEAGDDLETFTIITTEATPDLAAIHSRMPVILDPGDFAPWLDPATAPEALQALLKPYEEAPMVAYRVSRAVNKVANQDLTLIEPLVDNEPEAPAQGSLL